MFNNNLLNEVDVLCNLIKLAVVKASFKLCNRGSHSFEIPYSP